MLWSRRGSAKKAASPTVAANQGDGARWRRRNKREAAGLASDSEAFLGGHLAERLLSRGEPVPVWAWTNLLAHGSEQDLRADGKLVWPGWGPIDRPWRQARSYLAVEVLDWAEKYGSLEELQKSVLVPLELAFATGREVAYWTASRWAMEVQSALSHDAGRAR